MISQGVVFLDAGMLVIFGLWRQDCKTVYIHSTALLHFERWHSPKQLVPKLQNFKLNMNRKTMAILPVFLSFSYYQSSSICRWDSIMWTHWCSFRSLHVGIFLYSFCLNKAKWMEIEHHVYTFAYQTKLTTQLVYKYNIVSRIILIFDRGIVWPILTH